MNTRTPFGIDWTETLTALHGRAAIAPDAASYLFWDRRAGLWAIWLLLLTITVVWLANRQSRHTAVSHTHPTPTHPDQQWRLAP